MSNRDWKSEALAQGIPFWSHPFAQGKSAMCPIECGEQQPRGRRQRPWNRQRNKNVNGVMEAKGRKHFTKEGQGDCQKAQRSSKIRKLVNVH